MELIIDTSGNVLHAWFRKDGHLVFDKNTKYGCDFAIGIHYNLEQKEKFAKIRELKKYLSSTDYKAVKYAEGIISEEDYAPTKAARASARAQINELEFEEPTLTREEMDQAEQLAIERLKEKEVKNGTGQTAIHS